MGWWGAAAGGGGGGRRAGAAATHSNSPRHRPPHHHPHYHFQHRGVLSSGGVACCTTIRRGRYFFLALGVLAGVFVVNMVLLAPHLHTGSSSSSSSSAVGSSGSSSSGDMTGWHSSSKGPSAAPAAAAVASTTASTSVAGRGSISSSSSRSSRQSDKQQRGVKQQQQQPHGDLWHDFDDNGDGVLGPTEFQALLQEACRNDRSSLGVFSWLLRFLQLGLGLRPQYAPAGPYPCSLRGEVADATRQAAAVLSLAGGAGSSSAGSGSSSKQGRGSKGLRHEQRADTAAGAAAVDPNSPEGQAAARRAFLLSRCSPLTPELAAAAASHGTLLLVAADWGMFELFGVNWLTHVQRSGVDNYLMAALDQKTADFLANNKLGHCVTWNPTAPGGGEGVLPAYSPPAASPGSKQHAVLSWAVLEVAQVLLGWEYDVIASHLDTVWLTDPLPYLAAHVPAAADVVLSSEAPAAAAVMGSQSADLTAYPDTQHAAVGTGVTYIRGTAQGQEAVGAWLATHEAQVAEAEAAAAAAAADGDRPALAGQHMLLPDDVVRAWLSGSGSSRRQQQQQAGGPAWPDAVLQGPHPDAPKVLLLVGPPPGLWGRLIGSKHHLAHSAGVGVFTPVAVASSYSWFVQGVGWRAAAVVARSSSSAASGRKLPLAVHVGHGHSSREGRMHQLRDAQWYADGPKYYSDPKLLSFALQPFSSPAVAAGLANAPDFSQGELLALHVAALNHQLSQFYAGAAVAAALGRTLVLPTFQCYCYRDPAAGSGLLGGPGPLSWSSGSSSSGSDEEGSPDAVPPWACRAPGDDNSVLPFNCTLDQVLDPAAMYAHGPAFAGRPVLFREAPFLRNPRSPSWIRHAATVVSSGAPAGCSHQGAASSGSACAQVLQSKPPAGVNQQVVISPGLTDAVLTEVLAPFSAAKWLHFTDLPSVFGGFASAGHRAEFEAWLDRVVLPWCCKATGDDGGSIASSSSRSGGGSGGDEGGLLGDSGSGEEGSGGGGGGDGGMAALELTVGAAAVGADGSAATGTAASSFAPLQVITEVPTDLPGWAMVEVRARRPQQGGSV